MLLGRYRQRLRNVVLGIYNGSIGLVPRSDEPYATHFPVLVGVAAAIKPKLVIEFGCGTYSTLSFLDQVAFPSVQRVESYENNSEWFGQIRKGLPSDTRLSLNFVEGEMYRAIDNINISRADMIFIDDSPSARERASSVTEISRCCGMEPVVILHDNDLWRLRLVSRRFHNRISFNAFNPQCCVMWHGHPERIAVLKRVNNIIRRHANDTPLMKIRTWVEIFSNELPLSSPSTRKL